MDYSSDSGDSTDSNDSNDSSTVNMASKSQTTIWQFFQPTPHNTPDLSTNTISQDSELLALPSELLLIVTSFVQEEHLHRLRLTCKAICAVATPAFAHAFFSERRHAESRHSLQALDMITRHPVFGRYVKTISIGDAVLEEPSVERFEELMKENFRGFLPRYRLLQYQVFDFTRKGNNRALLRKCFWNLQSWGNSITLGTFCNEFVNDECADDCRHAVMKGYGSQALWGSMHSNKDRWESEEQWYCRNKGRDIDYEYRPEDQFDMLLESFQAVSLPLQGLTVAIGWNPDSYDLPELPDAFYELVAAGFDMNATPIDITVQYYNMPLCTECYSYHGTQRLEVQYKSLTRSLNLNGMTISNDDAYNSRPAWCSEVFGSFYDTLIQYPLRSLHLENCDIHKEGFAPFLRKLKGPLRHLRMHCIDFCDEYKETWDFLIDCIINNTTSLKACQLSELMANHYELFGERVCEYHDVLGGSTKSLNGEEVYSGLRKLSVALAPDQQEPGYYDYDSDVSCMDCAMGTH